MLATPLDMASKLLGSGCSAYIQAIHIELLLDCQSTYADHHAKVSLRPQVWTDVISKTCD